MGTMAWRCRACGGSSPCGSDECRRCGAARVRQPLGSLAFALSCGRAEDDEPPAAALGEAGPFEPARGPGPAGRFLRWSAGALLSVLAGIALLVGTVLGVTLLVGVGLKLRRIWR